MAYWQPRGEEGGLGTRMVWNGRGGEGVFIGPGSGGRPAKVAYVRYLSTAVQRLSRTSRYYPEGIPKSSMRPVLLAYVRCTIHRVRLYYLQSIRPVGDHRTSALKDSSVRPAFQRTSALKDRGVHPPTLTYVQSRSPIFPKCSSGWS
jgi:hypothetical protein